MPQSMLFYNPPLSPSRDLLAGGQRSGRKETNPSLFVLEGLHHRIWLPLERGGSAPEQAEPLHRSAALGPLCQKRHTAAADNALCKSHITKGKGFLAGIQRLEHYKGSKQSAEA